MLQVRGRPHGGVNEGELSAMALRSAAEAPRAGQRLGIEAAILAQADQERRPHAGQVERQLEGVIAGVEDEEGCRAVRRHAAYQVGQHCGGHQRPRTLHARVLVGTKPTDSSQVPAFHAHLARSKPLCA